MNDLSDEDSFFIKRPRILNPSTRIRNQTGSETIGDRSNCPVIDIDNNSEASLDRLFRPASEDGEEDCDVTASQLDQHSLVNILKAVRPDYKLDNDLKQLEGVGQATDDNLSQEDRCINRLQSNEPISGSASPRDGNLMIRSASRTSESCSTTTTITKQPSSTGHRLWSIPPRPRDRCHSATKTLAARPSNQISTPTPTKKQAESVSELFPASTSQSPAFSPPPSPFEPPSLEPFPLLPLSFRSPTSRSPQPINQFDIHHPASDVKGKGRALPIPISPSIHEHHDFNPVLVPDSSDTPPRSITRARSVTLHPEQVDELDEHGGLDQVLVPDSTDAPPRNDKPKGVRPPHSKQNKLVDHHTSREAKWTFDQSQDLQSEQGDRGVDLYLDEPVSHSKFFNHTVAHGGDEDALASWSARTPAHCDETTERENREKQLLADLGFDNDMDEPEPEAPLSSSPIQIIQPDGLDASGPSKPSRNVSRSRQELCELADQSEADSIEFEPRSIAQDHDQTEQSSEDQLRHIGIIVDDRPSDGIAPLMDTWPAPKRDKFRKMAGLIPGQVRRRKDDWDEDEYSAAQQVAQTEAWDALLVKQKKASGSRTKKKTWTNRPVWRMKAGRGRSRARGKNLGKITVMKSK